VSAPTGKFTVGTQVGVPTGTSLTSRSGSVGSPTGADETYHLVDPRGERTAVDVTVKPFDQIAYTGDIALNPPSGQVYLMRRCSFTSSGAAELADLSSVTPTGDVMSPKVIFEDCSFDGSDTSSKCVTGWSLWLVRCYLTGASDGISGLMESMLVDSLIEATTDGSADPHQDGSQILGGTDVVYWHCWIEALDASATSAVRIGTEFGAVDSIDYMWCTLGGGAYTIQIVNNGPSVTGVRVRGCRWQGTPPKGLAAFGATDILAGSISEWTDNKYLGDGTTIANPAP
jgi:hypothetical protein